MVTFPNGLIGFPDHKRFLLHKGGDAGSLLSWLLSLDLGGPELALVDPQLLDRKHTFPRFTPSTS